MKKNSLVLLLLLFHSGKSMQVAYVGNQLSDTVSIIDVATNSVIGKVTDPNHTVFDPVAIAITPDGKKAYVVNSNNTVSVIDVTTNMVTGVISGFSSPFAIAISPNGMNAYVINDTGNGTISIIDVATEQLAPLSAIRLLMEFFQLQLLRMVKKLMCRITIIAL